MGIYRKNLTIYTIIVSLIMLIGLLTKQFTFSGVDYLVYAVFILFTLSAYKFRLIVPKNYGILLLLMIAVMAVNAVLSPYSPPMIYVIIASLITCFPFINYILNYNFAFSDQQILTYINNLIKVISVLAVMCYLSTLVFGREPGHSALIYAKFFMLGFFASLCNQGVILALTSYGCTHRRTPLRIALFLSFTTLLTLQFKAIAGLMIIWGVYLLIRAKNKIVAIVGAFLLGCMVLAVLLSIPSFNNKLKHYNEIYLVNTDGIARVELYLTSFHIVKDFFPLGTGQGTFGSIPVNMVGSKVYADYGIDKVWGLGENDEVDFKMDTHWSAILGEMGLLGTLLYVLLFLYPVRVIWRNYRYLPNGKYYRYLISVSIFVILIESITLTLINQFCFMMIYSGLSAIIIRRINDARRNESITGNNQLPHKE